MATSGPPRFEPPYDSPMEDELAWMLVKRLDGAVRLQPQVEAHTICGLRRLDFVVTTKGKRVAFEVDGREHHDWWRDLWRDSMILGADAVDVIYRLPADYVY